MAKIMIDKIHLDFHAPPKLPEAKYTAMRRALFSRRFMSDLRRVVRGVVRRYASLKEVRVTFPR